MARKRFARNRAVTARRRRPIWEILESRILLTTFVTSDLGGTWYVSGISSEGTVQINDAGLVTGGLLSHIDDDPSPPSGTLSITSGGLVTLSSDDFKTGAMSSAKDIFALSDGTDNSEHSLDIGVRPLSSNFSNSDLTGTWTVTFDGDSTDSNGFGTVTFDGLGDITGGSTTDGSHANVPITGGSYTVNQDSTVSLIVNTSNGSLTGVGAINASKDFLAFNPPPDQFADAANSGSSLLFTLVRSSGAYTNADAAGTWVISGAAATGFLSLDSAGHIVGGQLTTPDGVTAVTGSYTLSASGALRVNAITNGPDGSNTTSFSGSMNASKDAMVMNSTSDSSNMVVLLKNATTVNHAPTLTTVAPFSGATGGTPFDITFAQLKAASNAADADGNTIQFQVQALGTSQGGDFTLNGDPVDNVPFLFSAGDTLEWMPGSGANGAVPVLSVRAFDGLAASATSVPVVVNTTISSPVLFNNDVANDTWNFIGTGAQGTLDLDDAGGLADDGSLTTDTNTTFAPSGSYTLGSDGSFSLSLDSPGTDLSGAMNRTQDVIALSNTGDHGLSLLVRHSEDNFSNADLSGTWTTEFTGDTSDNNGGGTLTFDGQGNITSGSVKSGTGTKAVSGTYTVDSDGTVSVSIGDLQLQGNFNASKDLVALGPPDLAVAASDQDPLLMVLVRSSGAYSNADLVGSWDLSADGSSGVITFDGAGHISGHETDSGGDFTLGGTYSITAAGALTANLIATQGDTVVQHSFTGAMNVNRNLMAINSVGASTSDHLGILISNGNHAPTLTAVAALGTAVAGHPFNFTYDDLLAASNAADADGDAISFNVTSVPSGSLSINGTPVSSFPATVEEGDTLAWTPGASANGNITAFAITASDGTAASATPVSVVIKTVLAPTISISANKAKASEINGTSSGMGQFTLTRTNGILGAPLDVTVTISGTATNGVDFTTIPTEIHFNASSSTATVNVTPLTDALAEGSETVILTLVASDEDAIYSINPLKTAGTVTIADAASTITVSVSKSHASEINGTSSGMGQFTLTRAGGNLAVSQTVTFTLSGTADSTHFSIPTSLSPTFDSGSSTGTVTFGPGKNTAVIPFFPIDDNVADTPALNVTLTVTPDNTTASYFIGAVSHATINIADAAPTFSVTITKPHASEINGSTSGMGQFTIVRTGGDLTKPFTVNFETGGTSSFAIAGTNYLVQTSPTVTFSASTNSGTLIFTGGKTTVNLPFFTLDDHTANFPKADVLLTLDTDAGTTYFVNPTKGSGDIIIADAASTVSVAETKNASEINGTTSGMGTFTFTRTGGNLKVPLTVFFNIDGSVANSATEGTDYITQPHSVTFAANKTTTTFSVKPIDDVLVEGTENVKIVLQPDANPSYFLNLQKSDATVTIADDTRKVIFGPVTTIAGAVHGTPFSIAYADLVTATNAQVPVGGTLTFKITKILKGTLKKGASPVVINTSTALIASGDSLAWTAPAAGTTNAFTLVALNGTNATSTITIAITAT